MIGAFGLLADFPGIGQRADELRRFSFQAHHIFYTEETADILIRTILHTAQRIRPQLFD